MTNKLVYLILLGCFGLFQTVCGQTNNCYYVPCICCLQNATCQSNGHCGGQCQDGYHGGRCLSSCPITCVACKDRDNPNDEHSFYGVANCTSCKPGYYSTPESFQCQLNCPDECNTCTSDTDCTSCKTGFYISNTLCTHCPNECTSCTTFNQCTQCKDGFYISGGVSGHRNCTPCSEGCLNEMCNNRTGVCICTSTNYSGDKCDSCAQNIEKYPQCNQCIAGFYGPGCKQDCPVNCNSKVCNRQTGNCIDGCNKNFTGDSCTFCLDGMHGHNCDKKCPVNCDGGVCNQSNGHCHSCKSNFTGETCDSCITGQYGINCDFSCPSNCSESICHRATGICYSCRDGLSGDKCCMKGTHCQSCISDSVCSECFPGKHGDQCGETCPEMCAHKICYKLNGTCISCVDGFHGDACTIASTRPDAPAAAVAGGVIVGLVVIIIAIVLLIFFKRRSSHKNENTTSMANTDVSTTERDYANDTVFTTASNMSKTYETLTKTPDTVTDYEPLDFGASLRMGEARQLSTEKTEVTNKLDASMKLDKKDKLNNSPKQDKPVKPEMAVKPCKPHKAAKVYKLPPQSVEDNDYYNIETSLKKSVPVIDLAS